MTTAELSDHAFQQFQRFIFDTAGISLSAAKKTLVSGRLAKRVQQFHLDSYDEYFKLMHSGQEPAELQTAVDLLTTNETYFFRESSHFDALRQHVRERAGLPGQGQAFRVWSAASSSGEEAYSAAMVLADVMPDTPWEVVGSDISTRVLARARAAHYSLERTRQIPDAYLKRFCLRGIDGQQGTLLIQKALRQRVRFEQVNLNTSLPNMGKFDVIFLRNVLIYFNPETKRQVVNRVVSALKPGGLFFIGHSESLHDVTDQVRPVQPSVYRKPVPDQA